MLIYAYIYGVRKPSILELAALLRLSTHIHQYSAAFAPNRYQICRSAKVANSIY